ncbi:MAG: hypothetical protein QM811_06785 [Pirellulales bacterium]
MDSEMMKLRTSAEAKVDQVRAQFADEMRILLGKDPEFFKLLHRVVGKSNTEASAAIEKLTTKSRRYLMQWLIPAARIGLLQSTFEMQDKYTRPDSEVE